MLTSKQHRVFLDTNVLVYEVDVSEPVKQARASGILRTLLTAIVPVISTQVISEYISVTTRKLKPALSFPQVQFKVSRYALVREVVPVTQAIVTDALPVVMLKSISWWDALLHATAVAAKVTDVPSEDLVHLGVLDNITYHDPFAPSFHLQTLLTP